MIRFFRRKYKKDVYLLLTAGDKWNIAKYLMKNLLALPAFLPSVISSVFYPK